jgi:prophage regulatory protein
MAQAPLKRRPGAEQQFAPRRTDISRDALQAPLQDHGPDFARSSAAGIAAHQFMPRIMPRSEVILATGLSDTTLWREYRAGRFPKPIPLTKNRVGWVESEVRAWIADRLQAARAG